MRANIPGYLQGKVEKKELREGGTKTETKRERGRHDNDESKGKQTSIRYIAKWTPNQCLGQRPHWFPNDPAVEVGARALISGPAFVARRASLPQGPSKAPATKKLRFVREYTPENQLMHGV